MCYKLLQFFLYYIKSQSNHKLHSPFVFEFYNHILTSNIKESRSYIKKIKELQQSFNKKSNHSVIAAESQKIIQDSSSHVSLYNLSIVTNLIRYYNCKHIIEISHQMRQYALVACAINEINSFNILNDSSTPLEFSQKTPQPGLNCINIFNGNFYHSLLEATKKIAGIDLVIFDGNINKADSLSLFEILLDKLHEESIIVIEHIHLDLERSKLWEALIKDPRVTLSIDIFHVGVLFFTKKIHQKQHFVLKS